MGRAKKAWRLRARAYDSTEEDRPKAETKAILARLGNLNITGGKRKLQLSPQVEAITWVTRAL